MAVTKIILDRGLNIAIDFVVEEELEWFKKQFSDRDIEIKYVVLTANESILEERLKKRGEIQYLDRSLFLLNKLKNSIIHAKYLVNTQGSTVEDIAKRIVDS